MNLAENRGITFSGTKKGGPFDIAAQQAEELLKQNNRSGRPNSDVVKPWINGTGLLGKPTNTWIIDFGENRDEQDVKLYEAPYAYVQQNVYPIRMQNRRATRAKYWWLHSEVASGLRRAIQSLSRYIATPRVAKYRLFVWVPLETIPDDGVFIFARDDDYFFGVLHSRLHEKWALRMGTWLGVGNDPRYTPTTTFETFPFPWPPDQEPTDPPAYRAISAAAQQLHEEREAWLNPPGVSGKALEQRTLTNLYNALLVFRGDPPAEGKSHPKIVPAAGDFAPRLDELHTALDHAVCDAYGWEYAVLDDEEEILRRLLALNLERAGQQSE
jgi:type II restriction/modification system DNA methylase subunit YeeA